MEQHDPSRRQYVPQTYTTQQPQQGGAPAPGQYSTTGAAERYRQQSTYLQESPSAASPAGRAPSDGQQVYGFGQGVQYGVQQSPVQYSQDIATPQSQRQPSQAYQQYGVYGMAQPTTGQSPYEQVSQYRSRANPPSETYGASFAVPQSAQYYIGNQPGQASASAPEFTAQPVASQYMLPNPYPQPGTSSAQTYPSTLIDPSQGPYSSYAPQPQYGQHQRAPPVEEVFENYQNQVRSIFSLTRDGSLQDIGPQLLSISQTLLGNAQVLGLTRDDENQHDERIRLWDEFNRAWLVTLQRQFDLTQEMMQGMQLREPQSIMGPRDLERLSSELVRLCDSVEKHGLVDYQMGVAEEDIMDLLLRCLALLNPGQGRHEESDPVTEPSAAGASRGR